MDELAREIGARVRKLRKARGLSQEDLAEMVGVQRQQVSRLEAGNRGMKADEVELVSHALQVDPGDLLRGGDPREAVRELLELIGYTVEVPRQEDAAYYDMVATLSTGPIRLQLAVQYRHSVQNADVLALRDASRERHFTAALILTDTRPDSALARIAFEGRVYIVNRDELMRSPVNLLPYVRALTAQFSSIRPEFISPELEGADNTVTTIDGMVEAWLDDEEIGHVVLLGEAGVGKSVVCDAVAARIARRFHTNPMVEPAPLIARLWEHPNGTDLRTALMRDLADREGVFLSGTRVFDRMLRLGRFVLILDGLDEMSHRVDPVTVRRNLHALSDLLNSGSRVLVSARTGTLPVGDQCAALIASCCRRDVHAVPRTSVYSVRPFDDERVLRFLGRRHRRGAEGMLAWIKDCGMGKLASIPILLSNIRIPLAVEREPTEVPRSRAALLDDVLRTAAEQEAQRLNLPTETMLRFWEEVAWLMWRDSSKLIAVSQLPEFERALCEASSANGRGIWSDLAMGTSVVLQWKSNCLHFAHELYREHLLIRRIFADVKAGSSVLLGSFWIDAHHAEHVAGQLAGDDAVRTILRGWLSSHKDPTIRDISAYLLGLGHVREAESALRDALDDEDIAVRVTAAHALVHMGRRDVIEVLGRAARAGQPDRRRIPARMLLIILSYEPWIDNGLHESVSADIRAQMSAWGIDDVRLILQDVLADPDAPESYRCIAARVAGLVGGPELSGVLRQLGSLQSQRIRDAAREAIAAIDDRGSASPA